MHIHSAKFIGSFPKISLCPKSEKPEYAFIGRSNVGKSSLINMLTQRKGLAKTSSAPGKTRLINQFVINEGWILTDLPGYGYAKVSKVQRAKFEGMITDYILKRESLANLFVLIDSRLPPQTIDVEFMQWLGENQVPFSIVFTKIDKLGGNKLNLNIKEYNKRLLEDWAAIPPQFMSSSQTGVGRMELLSYIRNINDTYETS